MERVDRLRPEIERLFTAKEERRTRLAALPFPEKVQIVIKMQQMTAPLLRTRGKQVRVWELPTSDI
jgi:hypothetical protein